MLLFDNHHQDKNSNISKILEFDPATKELLWSFAGSEDLPFYSKTCGTTQRLDNGNTLICESDAGRAFEITSEGKLVWEFYNPHRAGDENQYIGALYALHRVGHESEFDWLAPLGE